MRPIARWAWLIGPLGLAAAGCNPFLDATGGLGAPCASDDDCATRLECLEGVCVQRPDGGEPDGMSYDADGDGYDARDNGGTDCDDGNPNVHPNAAEVCNGIDDDCDEQTDEELDDRPCERSNEHGSCTGTETCTGVDGWYCDAALPRAEDCDGADDDCDGQTDEGLAPRACPLQTGVCAGAEQSCVAGAWTDCDYGPDYAEGPEQQCDLLDNDCDGRTDEEGELLHEAELGLWADDGVDNNCNGLIDEPGGVMVPVPNHEGVWIDVYEMAVFEHADCSGAQYGAAADDDYPAGWPAGTGPPAVELYACSLPDIIPSSHLSWYRARNACAAQGKRLCDRSEYSSACSGTGNPPPEYPYAPSFIPGVCNDALGGDDAVAATGQFEECRSEYDVEGEAKYILTYDMSGNLTEWLREWVRNQPECQDCAWVGGWSYDCTIYIWGEHPTMCQPTPTQMEIETMHTLSSCPVGEHPREGFPRVFTAATFGGRCCYEEP